MALLSDIHYKRKGFADVNEDAIYFESDEINHIDKHQRLEDPIHDAGDVMILNDHLMAPGTSAVGNRRWEHMFSILVEWGLYFGTCNVSRNTIALLADGSNMNIGEWLKRQKKSKRKGELLPDRLHLLQKLVDNGYLDWDRPAPINHQPDTGITSSSTGYGQQSLSFYPSRPILLLLYEQYNHQHGIQRAVLVPNMKLSTATASPNPDQDAMETAENNASQEVGVSMGNTATAIPATSPAAAVLAPAAVEAVTSTANANATATAASVGQEPPPSITALIATARPSNRLDRKDIVADPMNVIQAAITNFPIPHHYRRVIEKHHNIRMYGVTVMPGEEHVQMCNLDPAQETYKFKRYWYCCAEGKCMEKSVMFEITPNICGSRPATRHLRKVHNIFLKNAQVPASLPLDSTGIVLPNTLQPHPMHPHHALQQHPNNILPSLSTSISTTQFNYALPHATSADFAYADMRYPSNYDFFDSHSMELHHPISNNNLHIAHNLNSTNTSNSMMQENNLLLRVNAMKLYLDQLAMHIINKQLPGNTDILKIDAEWKMVKELVMHASNGTSGGSGSGGNNRDGDGMNHSSHMGQQHPHHPQNNQGQNMQGQNHPDEVPDFLSARDY